VIWSYVFGCPYCLPYTEHIIIQQLCTKKTQIQYNIYMLIENISVPFHLKIIVHGFKYSPTLKTLNVLGTRQVNIVTQIVTKINYKCMLT
jgi:hypothetical protein